MIDFNNLWTLLQPQPEYIPMRNYCKKIWEALPEEKQSAIYRTIEHKKQNKQFVDYNPLYAIQKNGRPTQQSEPEFLRGDEEGPIVQVKYNGLFKLCRPETAEIFHLPVINEKWKLA